MEIAKEESVSFLDMMLDEDFDNPELFRDIMHLYSVFVTALMYLTPVIYPMSILPEWLKKIVLLNPLTNILTMFRDVRINNMLPGISSILLAAVETAVVMVLGLYVFYKRQDTFILDI